MKRCNIFRPFILVATIISGTVIPVSGQSVSSGDEQGFEIPSSTQLPQDREALENAANGWWKDALKEYDERMDWYNDAKFGCFIHWGVYSEPGGHWHGKKVGGYSEHLMRKEQIPLEQYKKEVVAPFNPTEFDAEEWMQTAEDAGMKYFIITAKHHDGFAMYPSDAYPYDIRLTKWGKDPLRELRAAAKRHGIKFGFYYSHAFDWEHPDAPGNDWDYENPGGDKLLGTANWWMTEYKSFLPKAEKYVAEKSIPQIQELIKKYDPDILWFDTPSKLPLYLNIRILEAIREADSGHKIVVNGRLARFANGNLGDYANTGDRAAYFFPSKGPWESIPTTNDSYGYSKVDTVRKPASHFIRLVASAASKGGNILMNVGPMGNGKWDVRDVEIFKGVGRWLEKNGESIYGATRTDLPQQPWGVTTWKGDTLYAHIFTVPQDGKIIIGGLSGNIRNARMVADNSDKVSFRRIGKDDHELQVDASKADPVNTVVVIELDKRLPANPVRLLSSTLPNVLYTFDATLHGRGLSFGDGKVNRNHVKNWHDNSQSISWSLRSSENITCDVYLDYNTVGKDDNGTVLVEIADKKFEVPYTACPEQSGFKTIHVGSISIDKGQLECHLKGKEHSGTNYMTPIAIRLESNSSRVR